MIMEEIQEYPHLGTITRVVEGVGREDDREVTIYEGMMDETMRTDVEGRTLQTSSYVVSIPLTQDGEGAWIMPQKGDKIAVTRYGGTIHLIVDNAEPSQLGGISIYASRGIW